MASSRLDGFKSRTERRIPVPFKNTEPPRMTRPDSTSDRLRDHPAFLLFWSTRVASAMGYQMAGVAFGWLVYAETGSAYALGLIGLCQFLPMLALTFVAGNVADRLDRRRVVVVCQLIEGLTLAVLAAGIAGGWLGVPGVFAAVTVLGGARAFESPTLTTLLPAVVPAGVLPRAMAVSSSTMETAVVIGGRMWSWKSHFSLVNLPWIRTERSR